MKKTIKMFVLLGLLVAGNSDALIPNLLGPIKKLLEPFSTVERPHEWIGLWDHFAMCRSF